MAPSFARHAALLALLVTACASAGPTPPVSPTPATSPDGTRPDPSTLESDPTLDPARVGAATIGDPLYPGLGNLGYDVERYEIRVRADLDRPEATIEEVITARSTQALGRFSLDYTGIPVDRVSVDGRPAAFAMTDTDLVVTPPSSMAAGTRFEVSISIAGRPRGVRSIAGWQRTEGQVVAFGIYDGLASWLPHNGDPGDKAVVDLWLDVGAPGFGVGAGELVAATESGERRVSHWRAEAANTVTLAIREYEPVSLGSPHGFAITAYVPPSLGERGRARLDIVPDLLAMLGDRFGPYRYPSLTLAWVEYSTGIPDEGLVLWGGDFGEPSQLAHVLGHLWFSTNASPARPVDSWLRGAFANYCDLLWHETQGGAAARDRVIRDWHRRLGSRTDPPISPSTVVANQALFSRGPLGLHALRVRVGDATFFEILRTWLREHARGAARVEAFLEVAEATSGRDLTDWWQAWLVDEAVPDLADLGLEP